MILSLIKNVGWGMRIVSVTLKRFTTYGLLATVSLSAAGFFVILFTFPNLFYTINSTALPIGMGSLIDAVNGLAGSMVGGQNNSTLKSLRVPLAAVLPCLIWGFVVAALIRSIRARSWQPTRTTLLHLSIGIVSFPVFLWAAQLFIWGAALVGVIANWIQMLLANGIVRVLGFVVLGLVILAALAFLVYWATQSVGARWLVVGLVVAGAGFYFARDLILPIVLPPLVAVLGFVATVLGWILIVLVAIVLWVITILVLAYLGGTVVTPFRDAFEAGREPDRLADLAAGVGVATSVLIMAASYSTSGRGNFAALLAQASQLRARFPLGSLPTVLDLRFDKIIPPAFDPAMHTLFLGFNGVLDLLVVALACALGLLVLAFTAGSLKDHPGQGPGPTIVTLAFLRVLLAFLIVVAAMWLTSSSDSG